MIQCLRRHTFTAGTTGSSPGWGTKTLHASHGQRRGEGGIYIYRYIQAYMYIDIYMHKIYTYYVYTYIYIERSVQVVKNVLKSLIRQAKKGNKNNTQRSLTIKSMH